MFELSAARRSLMREFSFVITIMFVLKANFVCEKIVLLFEAVLQNYIVKKLETQ